ncbi:hypothetical protein B0H21DRAFT_750026 [Amylocystis lapponica]|nr:hypothetical protein B0H21DRAFT_750026 [Amylocystis lapponica]
MALASARLASTLSIETCVCDAVSSTCTSSALLLSRAILYGTIAGVATSPSSVWASNGVVSLVILLCGLLGSSLHAGGDTNKTVKYQESSRDA